MNVTPVFSDCLKQHGARQPPAPVFSIEKLNAFLRQAYSINTRISELTTYLHQIRPSYLALQTHRPHQTSSRRHPTSRDQKASQNGQAQDLTDNDRIRIDHETKTLLMTLASSIKEMSETATMDFELATRIATAKRSKRGFGALGRWAAGAEGEKTNLSAEEADDERQRNAMRVFRENVIWYLSRRLEGASERQRAMIEVRLERERERSKSSLYRAQNLATGGLIGGVGVSGMGNITKRTGAELEAERSRDDDTLDPNGMQGLSAEQRQLFQQEEQDMLRQYNDELNKIKTAESSLLEISSLQNQLSMELDNQEAHIAHLVQDAESTTTNVGSGNKELKKASERPSTARMLFYATAGYCTTLILWDWFI